MQITWGESVSGRGNIAKALRREGVWCDPETEVGVARAEETQKTEGTGRVKWISGAIPKT